MNIKQKRIEAGLSQQELANKTNIPKDRIGKWEQGKGKPKAEDSKILDEFFENYKKEDVPQILSRLPTITPGTKISLERSIELLTEDRIKVLSVIERLTTLLERQYHQEIQLDEPGEEGTVTKNKINVGK